MASAGMLMAPRSRGDPQPSKSMPVVTRNRIRIARVVAISADLVQIGFFPLFGEGFASPLNDALDVAVCLTLTLLIGWHYSFLPSFIAEGVPMLDLIPTWTLAVLIATRRKQTAPSGPTSSSGEAQDGEVQDLFIRWGSSFIPATPA